MKILLSGMRPTGPMHLGHLLGALNNWKKLQEQYQCYFMAADWHALMSEYENPSVLKKYIYEMVADWLAAGIDPQKSVIFLQSDIKEHLELFAIFSNIVPLAWLERCPTYKEQLREIKGRDLTTYGFLGYPVLQAADIMAYKASIVPIGVDQMPHLELTREIARKFNSTYKEVFPEPEALLTEVPKLLGTDRRKMSKSYNNFIALGEPAESIKKKVMSMITDPKRKKLSDKGHPNACNVFSYYKIFSSRLCSDIEACCRKASTGCTQCKARLADILIEFLAPYAARRSEILKDASYIENILKEGAKYASAIAAETMKEVYKAMGMK